jgi:two-component sensor histidine kinase
MPNGSWLFVPFNCGLRSGTVQTLALVLHGLVTNATKYGALSQRGASGHPLEIRSRQAGTARGPRLHLEWKERGVKMPPVGAERRGSGQGRELIEQALRHQFGAQTTFAMEAWCAFYRFASGLHVQPEEMMPSGRIPSELTLR